MAKKKFVTPQPKGSGQLGFYAAPVFYPRFLRKVADALDALVAFEQPDPTNQENKAYVGMPNGLAIPIYDEPDGVAEEELLQGWLVQYDANCWVFIPYIKAIENPDG